MVNKYKRKTSQASWDEKTMKLAMEEAAKTSVNGAAKKYGINLSTLQRHIKKGCSKKKLGRFTTVFTEAQELELLEYVFHMDNLFFGLTKNEFMELVFQYAERNNISHPFQNGIAGEDWYVGFKKRHPDITLRRPEPTSVARARGFNKPQVERFFDLLQSEIDKHDIDATRIYNVDETGIQTTSNKPPRVLSRTGKKQVGIISSAERGKLTTVVCCCNAAGSFVPPFLVFGRKRMVDRLLDGAPPGSAATCTDNGWINGPAFLEWLRHFVDAVRPSAEKKVILVMDNHESHKYLEALEFASKNNLIFVSLAPHTTHRMQPLDTCVYGPLKIYFERAVSAFQKTNVGRIISQYEVARLFGEAYMKAASTQNAVKGFTSTGIWPTNRDIFDESDFLPSSLTDRRETTPDEARQTIVEPETRHRQVERRVSSDSDRTVSPTVLDCFIGRSNCKTPIPTIGDTAEPETQNSMDTVTPAKDQNKINSAHVTPIDIRPLPMVAPNKTTRKRKVQRAEVLTSTPVKEHQREKEAIKLKKINGVKKNLKDLKPGQVKPSTSIKRQTKEMTKVKKGPKRNKNDAQEYRCLVCSELYINPPAEDWIKCDDCKMWAHEACTSYAGRGSYYCDLCQE